MKSLVLVVLSAIVLSGCVTIPISVQDVGTGSVTIRTEILKSNDVLSAPVP